MDRITRLTQIAQLCCEVETLDSAVDGALTPHTVSIEGLRAALDWAYSEGVKQGKQFDSLQREMIYLGMQCRWEEAENDLLPTLVIYGDNNAKIFRRQLPPRTAPIVFELETMQQFVGKHQ